MNEKIGWYVVVLLFIFLFGCSNNSTQITEVKHYPIDNLDGLINQTGIELDKKITTDENGALKIIAKEPTVIRLYETGDIDIENARLIYEAKLRTENVEGQVFLEMWCRFSDKGEYFSRALHAALSGSNEWTTQDTPFLLKKGENPSNVKLNVVINGSGTVWVDDIRLLKSPLK